MNKALFSIYTVFLSVILGSCSSQINSTTPYNSDPAIGEQKALSLILGQWTLTYSEDQSLTEDLPLRSLTKLNGRFSVRDSFPTNEICDISYYTTYDLSKGEYTTRKTQCDKPNRAKYIYKLNKSIISGCRYELPFEPLDNTTLPYKPFTGK